jgi:ribosomal protein S27E
MHPSPMPLLSHVLPITVVTSENRLTLRVPNGFVTEKTLRHSSHNISSVSKATFPWTRTLKGSKRGCRSEPVVSSVHSQTEARCHFCSQPDRSSLSVLFTARQKLAVSSIHSQTEARCQFCSQPDRSSLSVLFTARQKLAVSAI